MTSDVQFAREGHLARIVLNRPAALNALTLDMIRAIAPRLAEWAHDPDVVDGRDHRGGGEGVAPAATCAASTRRSARPRGADPARLL
jgi:enoyl-CoA hydratase